MELVGGQLAGGDPAVQLVGVVARISRLSGVKVHDDSLGRPEQETVTNMGAVSEELFSGVIVTSAVPVWPGVSVIGKVVGETGAMLKSKPG
jgi:hypothetical protein